MLEDEELCLQPLPKDFLLKALELCMKENIFYFGDLLFQQIDDTVIGAPCVVVFANLYTGRAERVEII